MKMRLLATGAALSCAALTLLSPRAFANWTTPPAPTFSITTGLLGDPAQAETVSFSGTDWCGSALHYSNGDQRRPRGDVTCGDTVFVGAWASNPSGGGTWMQSATVQSSPGGSDIFLANAGLISGTITLGCGSPALQLYAYDVTQGSVLTSVSIPYFACP